MVKRDVHLPFCMYAKIRMRRAARTLIFASFLMLDSVPIREAFLSFSLFSAFTFQYS